MHTHDNRQLTLKSGFTRVIVGTLVVLLVPFIAMQLSNEVNWKVVDFMIMAVLCLTAGFTLVFIFRRFCLKPKTKLRIILLMLAVFIYVWAELAVGLLSDVV
jgi:hypothetical protein